MLTAARVGVREFRKDLKRYLTSEEPFIVMKGTVRVAVVLPLSLDCWAQASENRAALARIKKMMRDQIEPAVLDWHW